MPILEVNNLKKVYVQRLGGSHVQALSDVTFSVEEGEYAAIMGESGSGKTTLLNILAAFDKPTSGEVLLSGRNINDISEKEDLRIPEGKPGICLSGFQPAGHVYAEGKYLSSAGAVGKEISGDERAFSTCCPQTGHYGYSPEVSI